MIDINEANWNKLGAIASPMIHHASEPYIVSLRNLMDSVSPFLEVPLDRQNLGDIYNIKWVLKELEKVLDEVLFRGDPHHSIVIKYAMSLCRLILIEEFVDITIDSLSK